MPKSGDFRAWPSFKCCGGVLIHKLGCAPKVKSPKPTPVRKLTMHDKAFWRRLTKAERTELMMYQTAPSRRSRSAYLPDDCAECPVCSQPVLGSGLCPPCSNRFYALLLKGAGRAALEEKG